MYDFVEVTYPSSRSNRIFIKCHVVQWVSYPKITFSVHKQCRYFCTFYLPSHVIYYEPKPTCIICKRGSIMFLIPFNNFFTVHKYVCIVFVCRAKHSTEKKKQIDSNLNQKCVLFPRTFGNAKRMTLCFCGIANSYITTYCRHLISSSPWQHTWTDSSLD